MGRITTEATRSLEIAAIGVTPNRTISIGVISAPPPAPVMPTRRPTIAAPRIRYGSMCISFPRPHVGTPHSLQEPLDHSGNLDELGSFGDSVRICGTKTPKFGFGRARQLPQCLCDLGGAFERAHVPGLGKLDQAVEPGKVACHAARMG